MSQSNADRLLALAEERGILRTKEVEAEGIPRQSLSRLVDRGKLVRIGRGLYQRHDHKVTAHHSLAVAAKRVPHGTVCLLSALRFHDLTTQNPLDVWLAIDHKAREPTVDAVSLRIVRMSGEARTEGVQEHEIEGVTVPIYEAAKTVADCFKYRSRVGLDVALEALRDYHEQGGSIDTLWHYAEVCHVRTVIRPYMEAIV
jgi:predicted transcriptional regulator of viral defense system